MIVIMIVKEHLYVDSWRDIFKNRIEIYEKSYWLFYLHLC